MALGVLREANREGKIYEDQRNANYYADFV